MLCAMTICWSMSFIWSKLVVNAGIASEVYLMIRYGMAALLLLPFSLKELRQAGKRQVKGGLILGVIMLVGMMLQVMGLQYTTPSNSGFITTAYVVLTPFTTWLMMRQKPSRKIFLAVGICLVGIYVLTMQPGETIQMNIGNVLTLVAAVAWAFHVTYISVAGQYTTPLVLSFIPFAVTSLGGFLFSIMSGSLAATNADQFKEAFWPIVLAAIFPTIVANLVQVFAQPHVDTNKAAIIYTMEAVFATIISILMGLESWSISVIAGGAIILVAVVITQFAIPSADGDGSNDPDKASEPGPAACKK